MQTAISTNKFVYDILSNDKDLKKLVGDKVFPLIAEETVSMPFVIFTKEHAEGVYTKDLLTHDEATISVACIAVNYFETVKIAERVRALLENRRDSFFYNVLLEEVEEEFVDDAFVQTLRFNAKIKITK